MHLGRFFLGGMNMADEQKQHCQYTMFLEMKKPGDELRED